MWFNSKQTEEPHQGLTSKRRLDESRDFRKDCWTGAAWLSSARSVRSTLKWDNERNPRPELYLSRETARPLDGRKEGQTSSQHGPYILGYTHVTMDKAEGLATW